MRRVLRAGMPASAHPGQRGAGLIEVLVAMLVLAIGLLGIAGLILNGARYSTDSYLRSQATVLVDSIVDRMREQRVNAADFVVSIDTATGSVPDCDLAAASAAAELACWERALRAAMPTGTTAQIAAITADEYQVVVSWFDRERASSQVALRFVP